MEKLNTQFSGCETTNSTTSKFVLGIRTFLPLLIMLNCKHADASKMANVETEEDTVASVISNSFAEVDKPEKKPELTKDYLLEQMKTATLLKAEILNMIPIYEKLNAQSPLSRSNRKNLLDMVQKYDLSETAQVAEILKKKRLNKNDFEFLLSVLKIVIKEEQKGVLAHNAVLKRMLAHLAIINAFRSEPELDGWLDDIPGDLETGDQFAAELGKIAQ